MSATEETKEKTPELQASAAPVAPKSRVAILLVAAVVILGLQAFMVFMVVSHLSPKPPKHPPVAADTAQADDDDEEAADAGEPELWEKPITKTVTIAGSGAKRYLKATFYLEYDKKKYPKFAADMEKEQPRAEFIMNQVLSVLPFDSLSNPAVQKKVSDEILVELNKSLPKKKLRVKEVLVTDWLLQ